MNITDRLTHLVLARKPETGVRGVKRAISNTCGISYEAVRQWFAGDTGNIKNENLKALAEGFDTTVDWLLSGTGEPPRRNSQVAEGSNVYTARQPIREPRGYPLISWVEAGEMTESPSRIGETHKWLESSENAGNGAYWLTVSGHSMTSTGNPNFPEGSLILVKPDAEIINGKYYVVEMLDSGEKTFKQYVEDAGYRYLRPLNDKYRTLEIDNNCRFIGRVVDTKMTGL